MQLKNVKFVNTLTETEAAELNAFNESCFEKMEEEVHLKFLSNHAQVFYLILTTSLLLMLTSVLASIEHHNSLLAILLAVLTIIYALFYTITNCNFRYFYVKLKYHKTLPLVNYDTLKICLKNKQRIRASDAAQKIAKNPDLEIRYLLTADGLSIMEGEHEPKLLTGILPINEIKFDASITELVYDISDLSMTFFSESDPLPKEFLADENDGLAVE